tara:strand:+ start:570 stop:1205 length:636 start_codon:yes stop_codon:yes gene_type:complete
MKKNIEIALSIGSLCFSSQLLKDNYYKKESYPFDWIASNIDMVTHAINDDFKTFLDTSQYIISWNKRPLRGSHKFYEKMGLENIFRHHNPRNSYSYFKRCVTRFKNLYENNNTKLFIYYENHTEDLNYEDIIKLNNTLKKKIDNFYILVVNVYSPSKTQKHTININDNIFRIDFFPLGYTNGRQYNFEKIEDKEYLSKIIHTYFDFTNLHN